MRDLVTAKMADSCSYGVGNLSTISEYFVLITSSHIFSLSLATIGIFLAIFFYLKGKKEQKPTFSIRSFNLVKEFSKKITSIELLYFGEKVENLTITKVAFWNDGDKPIRKDDIAAADPLKIVVDNKYEIFEAEILDSTTNEANQFELVKKDNKSRLITFDFLSHNEGAIMQIAHSGLSSKDVNVTGRIIESGKPKEVKYIFYKPKYMKKYNVLSRQRMIFILIFLAPIYFWVVINDDDYFIKILFSIMFLAIIVALISLFKFKDLPEKFKPFWEGI